MGHHVFFVRAGLIAACVALFWYSRRCGAAGLWFFGYAECEMAGFCRVCAAEAGACEPHRCCGEC